MFDAYYSHFSMEALSQIESVNYKWPSYDEELLIEKNTKIVIQINGKKRTDRSRKRN